MPSEKTLDELLVDEDELHENLLTEVLAPFVQIGNKNGAFIPTEEFEVLDSTGQTAIVLLYQKAAFELDLAEQEGATPSDASEIAGLNHNTVKTAVRKLDNDGIAVNDDGVYSIPPYNYEKVSDLIENE